MIMITIQSNRLFNLDIVIKCYYFSGGYVKKIDFSECVKKKMKTTRHLSNTVC